MQRRLVGVLLLGAALANATPALAQPADPADPAAADKAEKARQARALYEEGNTAYNLANFDEAISKFKAAYALTGAPGLLFNIAQAYRLKKEYEQALYFYRTYLRLKPDAQNRGDVEARIAEMEQMLEEQKKLGSAKPVGTMPPDGNPAGQTPPGGATPGGATPGGTPPGSTAVADGGSDGGSNTSATLGENDDDTTIGSAWSPKGSTFGMELRADVDTAKFKGAVFAVGVTFAITPALELAASALLGGEKGANLGGRFLFGTSRLRPLIMIDAPVFFTSEKTLVGVHGAAGLRWDLSANFGLELDLGVSHFFGPPEGVIATYFVPSLSLQGRL